MKIACFTDIHFGRQGNNREHNERCLSFVGWFLEQALADGVDRICFLGDWHDNRSTIGVETLSYSDRALGLIAESGLPCEMIVGNHDMPFRDTRRAHSLSWMRGVDVVDEPKSVGDALFVPFLVPGDDLAKVASLAAGCEFAFGHFEFPGFMMNERYAMPAIDGHMTGDELTGLRYVFSGHFHARQSRRNKSGVQIVYIGNCFPHDFGDAGDFDRGMMTIESGGDPEYASWPDQPTYHLIPVSKLADELPNLGPTARVRSETDVQLSDEDRDSVIEVAASLGIASLQIVPPRSADVAGGESWDGSTDVRGFVLSWLTDEENAEHLSGADAETAASIYMEATR